MGTAIAKDRYVEFSRTLLAYMDQAELPTSVAVAKAMNQVDGGNTNPRTVRGWMCGGTLPKVHTLPVLAKALGVPLAELVEIAGRPPHEQIRARYQEDPTKTLAYMVNAWREEQGYTTEQAAKVIGMSKFLYSKVQSGSQIPGEVTLCRLAMAMDLPTDVLFRAARLADDEPFAAEDRNQRRSAVGKLLHNVRMALNLSLPALAEITGYDCDRLGRLEWSGVPTREEVVGLADALHMDRVDILRAMGIPEEHAIKVAKLLDGNAPRLDFATALRTARERQGLSQAAVAHAAGYRSPAAVCRYEGGQAASFATATRLAETLEDATAVMFAAIGSSV